MDNHERRRASGIIIFGGADPIEETELSDTPDHLIPEPGEVESPCEADSQGDALTRFIFPQP